MPLFDARKAGVVLSDSSCDVTADGRRFLRVVDVGSDRAQPASVFVNWGAR